MKKIYMIRHCEASGQEANAPLTENGHRQAKGLVSFFETLPIDRILSSPFRRAIESINAIAVQVGCSIEIHDDLRERALSSQSLTDWQGELRRTFIEFDYACPGGETSAEATRRIQDVMNDVWSHSAETTILVTHGNLLTLYLHSLDSSFDFEQGQHLRNPDVFLVKKVNGAFVFENLNIF
ncbi:MAG TPA: histidine phosphatase family protein [Exiguobacterium sp.]|uniref:histidine phosphatase family protein n=1 Tax=Exiguobacterium sp. TaxID=44751 RepID=UPI000ECB2061|nr:histidine phosphatase family protein [Exiguobacterium sp.]HCN57511.1 histidine phosphatase family protein [Exiguobacterium sp.]